MILAAHLVLLLLHVCFSAAPAAARGARPPPRCLRSCAGVSVPYPFGVSDSRCYWPGFNLTCDRARGRLLIGDGGTLHVVEISLATSTVRVMDSAGAVNITFQDIYGGNGTWGGGLGAGDSPYVVSERHSQLVVTGCNVQATLVGEDRDVISGCSSFCSMNKYRTGVVTTYGYDGACSGIGCCETPIPIGRPAYGVLFRWLDEYHEYDHKLPIAVRVAQRGWFHNASAALLNDDSTVDSSRRTAIPVVLEFALDSKPVVLPGVATSACPEDVAKSACQSSLSSCRNVSGNYRSGYVCQCQDGYHGNPYLAGGCQDIDKCAIPGMCSGECTNTAGGYICQCPRGAGGNPGIKDGCVKFPLADRGFSVGIGVGSGAGLLMLVLAAVFVTRKLKHRRAKMLKHKFFKENRGHLLRQLVSQKADIAERMIIPLVELEKATNNFDKAREIGGGGHGTVYKGIMSDLHVVAVKKSKVAIQREINEFINEVAILSQINHRNVVKLFGCCLKTEVPLLVYEFISNGTLYHHLHVEEPRASLRWVDRLRIATETARALAYLHSAMSFPIVHRDIKSQNILLDDTLVAKVSDFGASRCIPVDQTGDITVIQGTLGYLDPTYYYSGWLTEKSDVYSFGVFLMELLTRKKPCSYRSSEEESLVAYFTTLLAAGDLVHMLDPQVMEEGGTEVEEVAVLAVACVRMDGDHRPTMRQVEMTLENLRVLYKNVVMCGTNSPSYKMTEGRNTEDESRQYSLEEEYLFSSKYPR